MPILPWVWLGILIICIIIEAFTQSLTTIWAAIAAFPLIFLSRTSLSFSWQLLLFLIITVLLIVFTRPFALKHLKMGKYRSNINTLEGAEVLIVKAISKFEIGEAKAKNGVIWNAKSENDEDIAENTICVIVSVNGNTLIVKEKK